MAAELVDEDSDVANGREGNHMNLRNAQDIDVSWSLIEGIKTYPLHREVATVVLISKCRPSLSMPTVPVVARASRCVLVLESRNWKRSSMPSSNG